MTLLLSLEYEGYTIDAHDMDDVENPMKDNDLQPVIVLHNQAQRRYGWNNHDEWARRINVTLDQIADHGVIKSLYGKGGALDVIDRWLRIHHKTRSFPFSAIEHSGVAVYLGSEAHMQDPGGWDSGWVGWILYNAELAGYPEITDDQLDEGMRAAFGEFACWVSGDVFGYTITDPDGEEVEGCWGFFGLDNLSNDDGWLRQELIATIQAHQAAKQGEKS